MVRCWVIPLTNLTAWDCHHGEMHYALGVGLLAPSHGGSGIPTKTPLLLSQLSGYRSSFCRLPLQVCSTSFVGSALRPYLFLFIRAMSCCNFPLRPALKVLVTSLREVGGWLGFITLQHLDFHSCHAHSSTTILYSLAVPSLGRPFVVFTFVIGAAIT